VLVTDRFGRPLRTIITGRHAKPTGIYVSAKNGMSMPWDGIDESHLMWDWEVDTNTLAYLSQPHRLEHVWRGKKLIYIPDLQRKILDNLQVVREIVEVKKTEQEIKDDPDYELKLELAESIYASLGWRFRKVYRNEIRAKPRFPNVRRLHCFRHTRIDARTSAILDEIFSAGAGVSTIGYIGSRIGGEHRSYAVLAALMVRRLVNIDLARPLGVDTKVTRLWHTARGVQMDNGRTL
jgi:hypothetical protein